MLKPTRPYRNIKDFAAKHQYYGARGIWPCLACRAKGRIYDPDDPPDPVEGYRHCRTLNCPICKGSGKGSKKECQAVYRKAIEDFKAREATYKTLLKARNELSKTLSSLQIEAIREIGI
jgi:hypothetical protein